MVLDRTAPASATNGWQMTIPRAALVLAATLALALSLGVERAAATTVLGSLDPRRAPDAFACDLYACPAGTSVGFRQLALYGSEVATKESGVLVAARVSAKRIAGAEQPRIAVLRSPGDDDIGVMVEAFAPLPVVSEGPAVHEVQGLHVPVEAGDSIGFLLPGGQVDLGVRMRRQPDGSVQWFTEPCEPCHMDGGTGRELLLEATIEPDEDEDALGDESQDPDFGGGGELPEEPEDDELDDWFDELDEDEETEAPSERKRAASKVSRRLRLLDLSRTRNGDPLVRVGMPGAGLLGGIVTTSAGRWDLGVPRAIGLARELRNKRVAQHDLRLRLSREGRRLVRTPGRQRARVVVYHVSRRGIKVTMRQIRL
jgi:hypothetical protein